MIDQDWLDEHMYSEPADLEPELNRLAEDAGRLADCEDRLIKSIQEEKRNLERLPEIIQGLERQLNGVSQELGDAIQDHIELSEARGVLLRQQLRQRQSPATKAAAQFPYRCNECGEGFMGGRGAMLGDLCPVCGFGHIIDAEVEA